MTLVKFNGRPASQSFNNLVDDLFATMPSLWREEFKGWNKYSVPVNIREAADVYHLDVVAPGLSKEDFKVNLDNNILTVSFDQKEEETHLNGKNIRTEFKLGSFKRSFTLNETVDAENISASYQNGVLQLLLPKKATLKPAVKTIAIQ